MQEAQDLRRKKKKPILYRIIVAPLKFIATVFLFIFAWG